MEAFNEPVSILKGVGPHKLKCLEKLGIKTVGDLIGHYPRDYEDRREIRAIRSLAPGETVLLSGRIDLVLTGRKGFGRYKNLRILVTDDSGSIEAVFFNAGYLSKTVKTGMFCQLFGKISESNGKLQILHPEISTGRFDKQTGILPIYPLSAGISQNDMRRWISQARELTGPIDEYLPEALIRRNRLCGLDHAVTNIHFPETPQKYQEAKFRLIFEELLLLQTGLLAARKRNLGERSGIGFSKDIQLDEFTKTLPFELTGAQKRVIETISRDMESALRMNRLIQGDVGSGKTVVAAAAIYKAVKSGYQAAMMAPTELLAKQHYDTMNRLFSEKGIRTGLLTSGVPASDRKKLLLKLQNGEMDLLVGTHAVLQPNVVFQNLGLVITDEQHRFGVRQRSMLADKGRAPDLLVMTATPIPRTLAIILYGDLDISVIDEMPSGRREIITKVVRNRRRKEAYDFVSRELSQGRQAYIVAPLIEDSEELEAKSAESLFRELGDILSPFKLALLHGGMKQKEKDAAMAGFQRGDTDALVSTVVIEVGIDVPNATVMLIENAERFGLAQLHQLRGRVGRGEEQSYCILVSDAADGIAGERLSVLAETGNGFEIAEKDLSLRGPGEFFGTRQHGVPELKIADLGKHLKVLETVRIEAMKLLEEDAGLEMEQNQGIRLHIEKMFSDIENFNL